MLNLNVLPGDVGQQQWALWSQKEATNALAGWGMTGGGSEPMNVFSMGGVFDVLWLHQYIMPLFIERHLNTERLQYSSEVVMKNICPLTWRSFCMF